MNRRTAILTALSTLFAAVFGYPFRDPTMEEVRERFDIERFRRNMELVKKIDKLKGVSLIYNGELLIEGANLSLFEQESMSNGCTKYTLVVMPQSEAGITKYLDALDRKEKEAWAEYERTKSDDQLELIVEIAKRRCAVMNIKQG